MEVRREYIREALEVWQVQVRMHLYQDKQGQVEVVMGVVMVAEEVVRQTSQKVLLADTEEFPEVVVVEVVVVHL
jgi:hypothetical protein